VDADLALVDLVDFSVDQLDFPQRVSVKSPICTFHLSSLPPESGVI